MKYVLILLAVLMVTGLVYYYYPREPKNLILITVDTLRADHLSLHGYQRDTSPELASRAKTAVVFDRAFVQWPKTVPSMVSIFTSTYPHTNGIMFGSRGQHVADKLTTVTEVFRDHGFETHGVVSNAVLAAATHFSQGFAGYDETWLDKSRGKEHPRADHVTDLALAALSKLEGKIFFVAPLCRSALPVPPPGPV